MQSPIFFKSKSIYISITIWRQLLQSVMCAFLFFSYILYANNANNSLIQGKRNWQINQ